MNDVASGGWTPDALAKLQHDLRNPLTAVMGFSQLLQATKLDTQQAECVDKVLDGARRLLDMIEAIPERVHDPVESFTDILYIEDVPTTYLTKPLDIVEFLEIVDDVDP